MDPRTTTSGRRTPSHGRAAGSRRAPHPAVRRPGLFLAVAAAGAVLVNVVVPAQPAAQAEASTTEAVSVAEELGLTADAGAVDVTRDLAPLEDLVASRSSREAAETAALKAQAAADRAELERERAEKRAEARAAAKAAAAKKAAAEKAEAKKAAASEAAAQEAEQTEESSSAPAPAPASTAVAAVAQISNTAGPIRPQAQAAANAVVSNVPGAGSITIGGTRPSAADPGGHPSGLALDYMVMSDAGLGDAIVQYHIANWDALGVDYIIWQQRYLGSPGGSWSAMEDRGSATANHMDHPHVNYRG